MNSKNFKKEDKILIVGGGPAGSSTAITLLKQGFKNIVILEKGSENREKVCGDGLNESQLEFEKLGVFEKIKGKALEIPSFSIFGYGNKEMNFKSTQYTLQREITDQVLRDEVENLGGKVEYETEVKNVETNAKEAILKIKRSGKESEIKGNLVVLATGANITLAKKLGFEYDRKMTATVVRSYAKNEFNIDSYLIWINEKMAPGYGWIFPVPGNKLNIGFGFFESHKPSYNVNEGMDIFLDILEKKFGKKIELESKPKGLMLRSGLKREDFVRERLILVGENLHTTYSLSGEGVGTALKNGILAGHFIENLEGDYSEEKLKPYENLILDNMSKSHNFYNRAMNLVSMKWFNFLTTNIISNFGFVQEYLQNRLNKNREKAFENKKILDKK